MSRDAFIEGKTSRLRSDRSRRGFLGDGSRFLAGFLGHILHYRLSLVTLVLFQLIAVDRSSSYDNVLNTRPEYISNLARKVVIDAYF